MISPILIRLTTACVLAFSLANTAAQAQISSQTETEIKHLLDYLEQSGCQFNRNGNWHSAAEAAAHLQQKYQYLLSKNLITTTESFITGAASKSSVSGKNYAVQCAMQEVLPSEIWFATELHRLRQQPH